MNAPSQPDLKTAKTLESKLQTSRAAKIQRKTKETDIAVHLELDLAPDAIPVVAVQTGIGFFDHMLEAFARHGHFNLQLQCVGDLHIDQHHTVEDVGIVLGQAFALALGDLRGIERFAFFECPLDEALAKAVVDISGRPFLHYGATYKRSTIGTLDSSLIKEFFGGFVLHARWTLHLDVVRGDNDHHVAEAMFKAFARAARAALRKTGSTEVPSTKGMLV